MLLNAVARSEYPVETPPIVTEATSFACGLTVLFEKFSFFTPVGIFIWVLLFLLDSSDLFCCSNESF